MRRRDSCIIERCVSNVLVNFVFRIIEFNWKSVRVFLILDRDSVDGKRIRMKGITFSLKSCFNN